MDKKRKRKINYNTIIGTAIKPRLSVFRSHNHICAQLIDDEKGETILSSSTLDKSCFSKDQSTATCIAATIVGKQIAQKSLQANIKTAIFDRGKRKYHGRIKAVVEAARNDGLQL